MEIKYNEQLPKVMKELQDDGIFLTVKGKEKENTMTIGWGFVGYMWNKPVFIVAVRYSRFTYELLKETEEFTVSVPLNGQLKDELIKCGSKSGRDYDKFKDFNIKIKKSKKLDTPLLADCDLHYECKIIYRQTLEAELIDNQDIKNKYKDYDYHAMYYGEIISCHN